MNAVEMMIAFLLMLMAWLGAEAVALFSEAESNTKVFAMSIEAEDSPIAARISPGVDYTAAGFIWRGVFELGNGPIMNDGMEWWEVRISPFSKHFVWIAVDYSKMTTVWIQPDKIINYGKDEVY